MNKLTKRQKKILIELINQRIAAIYQPKEGESIAVDGQMLKTINRQLDYRRELIEIRCIVERAQEVKE